jgi:hypothetical protein
VGFNRTIRGSTRDIGECAFNYIEIPCASDSHLSRKEPLSSSVSDPNFLLPGLPMTRSGVVYRCAALVMFPKEKQLSLMLSSGGAKWASEELEKSKSEGPSKENHKIIDFLAQQGREGITATILKIAIEWNDAVVWGRIVERDPEFFFNQTGYTDLCNGWQLFGFDGVRPT